MNRVDDIIVFSQLTREDIRQIASHMIATVAERLKGLGIGLTVMDEALDKLAEEGFDPVYGARPLRRKIQSALEDQVAEKMLDGTLKDGDTARATLENDKIVVDKP